MPAAIELSGVELWEEGSDRLTLDLAVEAGRCLALVGPLRSGAGAVLRICVGLSKPESGRVIVLGVEVASATEEELASLRVRCGAVFRQPGLLSNYSVFNNIALPLRFHRLVEEDAIEPLIMDRLGGLGLGHCRDRLPSELAAGEAQSVALIRALIHEPDLLLLEDPGRDLDVELIERWMALLDSERRTRSLTILMTGHQRGGLLKLADLVAYLHDGRVEQMGTPAELLGTAEGKFRAYLE